LKLASAGAFELPCERVRLKHAFGDPDSRELQDRSVLERDFHVARDAIRRGIGTFGQGKGDAVLLVEEGWGALALERELRALEVENGVGRRVQILLGRASAASGRGRWGILTVGGRHQQAEKNENRVDFSHGCWPPRRIWPLDRRYLGLTHPSSVIRQWFLA